MTKDLVEIVARAMAERRIRLVRKWDTDPEELEKRLPKAIDRDWSDHTEDALAALRAIEGAGYKVVGREPSEAMQAAMLENVVDQMGVEPSYLWQAAFDAAPAFGGE